MLTPVEQALITLVPTLNVLPKELVNLANSILVQSRSKAPNLKAEEEIGRIYACADIAYDRLKSPLNLDRSQPSRPPCPPRVYKKLLTFLQGVLTTSVNTSQPTTPSKTGTSQTPRGRETVDRRRVETAATPNGTPAGRRHTALESMDIDSPTARRSANLSSSATAAAHSNKKRKLSTYTQDNAADDDISIRDTTSQSPPHSPTKSKETSTPSRKLQQQQQHLPSISNKHAPNPPTLSSTTTTKTTIPATQHPLPAKAEILLALLPSTFLPHNPHSASRFSSHLRTGLDTVLSIRGYHDSDRLSPPAHTTTTTTSPTTTTTPKPASASSSPDNTITPSRLPALMIVLTLYINAKLSGKTIDEKEFLAQRARAVDAVMRVRAADVGVREGNEKIREEEAEEEKEVLVGDVQILLRAAVQEGWLVGAWFRDISAGGWEVEGDGEVEDKDGEGGEKGEEDGLGGRVGSVKTPLRSGVISRPSVVGAGGGAGKAVGKRKARGGDGDWEDEENAAAGLQPGLRTMFQDAVDWLSEERRHEYARWKRDMLTRIQRITGGDASENAAKTVAPKRPAPKNGQRLPRLSGRV